MAYSIFSLMAIYRLLGHDSMKKTTEYRVLYILASAEAGHCSNCCISHLNVPAHATIGALMQHPDRMRNVTCLYALVCYVVRAMLSMLRCTSLDVALPSKRQLIS
jgi:hypothetical protein